MQVEQDGGGGILDDLVDAALPDIPGIPIPGVSGIPGVDGLVAGLAESLFDTFLETLGEALTNAAIKMNELVIGYLNSSTTIDLTTLSGNQALRTTTAMGIALVLAFFFAAIIRGLIRGEYSLLARAALVDVPMAIVGTLGLVTFAQLLLGITDAATAAMLGEAATNLGEGQVGVLSSPEVIVSGGLIAGLLTLVYIVAALLTWLWLFLRAALIYFIIVAAPLGIATRAFPPAAIFARRTIEMAIALIVSKFFLAIALAVGAEQFAQGSTEGDISGLAVGAGTMVLAAFMPSVILKLIPMAEGATASAGAERAPLRMAATAATIGAGMAMGGAAAGAGGAAGSTGGGAAGGVGAAGSGGGGAGPSGPGGANPGTSGGTGPGGTAGTSGPSGTTGPQGTSGQSGASGTDGQDGMQTVNIGSGGIATVSGSRDDSSDSGSFAEYDS